MDLPSEIDPHAEVIIEGIMSEEVEEINDAYKDILEELGENFMKYLLLPTVDLDLCLLHTKHACMQIKLAISIFLKTAKIQFWI